jgi:hypothetical protein
MDDAVFSCWHLINQPGAEVTTIFAGIPPQGTSTMWDRLCGQADSAAMMRKRRQENKTALKNTSATSHNLDYLDTQYRSIKPTVAEIANSILSRTSPATQFFAPLAGGRFWRHPDHVTVRKVGEYLLSQGRKVSFYGDIPYMRIPANPSNEYKDKASKRAVDLLGANCSIEVYELSRREQILKLEAMRQYESQYKMVNLVSAGTLKRQANLQREVIFHPQLRKLG